MANSDWIEWKGGECPVPSDAFVHVRFRDGKVDVGMMAIFWDAWPSFWRHQSDDRGDDIIAYRIVEPRHD